MITIIVLVLVSEFLYGLFDGEMDTIKFRPQQSWFPESKWYISNPWKDRSWWIKVPFSMLLDGWHFVKYLKEFQRALVLVLIIVLLSNISFYWLFASIGLYAYRGICWELTYGN